ncbi:cupin domain-containing protein [Piscinibacter sp.]|uniref:cupin domain-containing protein n=1 Tax=Piscinibacter sp. TaxID=1903157 RepID=UPI002F3EE2B9
MSSSPSAPLGPGAALRLRLMMRVQASQAHESQFLTIRRDAGAWHTLAGGARVRPLVQTAQVSSSLIELPAGVCLPVDPAYNQCEMVLLVGDAICGDLPLREGDACVTAGPDVRVGRTGARLYLRRSRVAMPVDAPTVVATGDDSGWDDFCPGVRIRELWNGGERRSLLVRMRAGASVGAHDHALEEECMMLAGEAFIGDTLLRSGEFQLAPRGSRHGEVTTDVGALFFVHGALDPTAYA